MVQEFHVGNGQADPGGQLMAETNLHFARAREALDSWSRGAAQPPRVAGLFEAHIFCTPLDPSHEEKERFVSACDQVGVKALCLGLDYEGRGVVSVLQSTRYHEGAGVAGPVALMLRDAEALARHFEVVRLKLEAVYTNEGVPQTDEQARQVPDDTYFEYHLKVDAPVSAENDERLKGLARDLTRQLNVKTPFSCNNMREKNQRFLNARTYGLGYGSSSAVAERVADAIAREGFTVSKVIREFIVFDTNKDLDRGWLEF
jgi:hypothetical protein